ncbi:response regulator [Bacillus timonensis]|uniref:response regulator n=1 Tax=Bacillus timonensis TaxID=1033734 RepID=UPI000289EDA6|nr:response regulator [Bacillus timonensis]
MKIRTKLLLGLSTLPILLIVLIVVGLSQISSLDKMNDKMQANYELTIIAEETHREIKDEGIRLRNLVLFNDEETIQKEIAKLQETNQSILGNIALLEEKIETEEQHDLIQKLKNINTDFNVYQNEVIDLVKDGKKSEALDLIDESSVELHEDFFTVLSEITDSLEINMESSLNDIVSEFKSEIIISALILFICVLIIMGLLSKSILTLSSKLNKVSTVMKKVANGQADLSTKVEVVANDEIDEVASAFNRMTDSLEDQMKKEQELTWAKSNIAEITTSLTGKKDLESLAQTFLSKTVPLVESSHAVFYVKDMDISEDERVRFKLLASYAFKERKNFSNIIHLGEGLIGQAALEKSPIILSEVPSDYVRIASGLGEASPLYLYVLPIVFEGDVKAVLEIASFKTFNETQQEFLEELMDGLGIIIESVMGRIRLAKLLEESQTLMEEIQAQSEELQAQQEELRATNEELEEQTQALRQSEEKLQVQQEELEQTNADLEEKAKNLVEQNKRFEQTNREVEAARVELEEKAKQLALSSKYKSEFLANMSHELRTPLNSLLILSKLLSDNSEGNLSGKQVEYSKTIYSAGTDLLALINDILDLAKIESGKMEVNPSQVVIEDLADFAERGFRPIADEKGLQFTIHVKNGVPPYFYNDEQRIQQVIRNLLSNAFKFTQVGEVRLEISSYQEINGKPSIAFSVIDSGIGIPTEKQGLIFEAFQQADGTTSRKYGGTGLGLSISREIASLLGGKILLQSKEGKGSNFTFIVGEFHPDTKNQEALNEVAVATEEPVVMLPRKEETFVTREETPTADDNSYIKRLLLIDDDVLQRNSLMEFIGDMDVIIKAVSSGHEAIEELKVNSFDILILDLGLRDTNGFDLLEKIKNSHHHEDVKVLVYTGRDLTSKEENFLTKYVHRIIIKDEHSPQRLKEEIALLVDGNIAATVEETEILSISPVKDSTGLLGKKILLVDDDVRNVYAISSILEMYGMNVVFAENGIEGIESLQQQPDIDLVLMDIMMPEMDGYEAIKRIRENTEFTSLPIIALTAKAMKEDREKCMKVGASDYIVKPINPDQLISLMKVWLYQ